MNSDLELQPEAEQDGLVSPLLQPPRLAFVFDIRVDFD